MLKITYLVKGVPHNYIRIDHGTRTITLRRSWRSGGLLYGYVDRFNVVSIALEDIVNMEEV